VQVIQLYISDQRVEMFKDESVTITDSIQNVKDIEKVFTAFSQSFSVPASKANNKIFKHYYNFDIIDGFDARKKVASKIELNHLPFRTGKIKLEGVDLKNNKPHTYRITFFGDIVDLKDKLGEKKLSDLSTLSSFDLNYDAATIKTKLQVQESASNNIIAPLITHTQRLFYNSDPSQEVADDGNLKYYSGGGSHHHGVKFNQLKYAIRVNTIIEAIETQFGLSFSSDFFKNTSIEKFDHLFLWLHRKSGAVEDLSGVTTKADNIIDFGNQSLADVSTSGTLISTLYATSDTKLTRFDFELNTTSTDPYDVTIQDFAGQIVYSSSNNTGNLVVSAKGSNPDWTYAPGFYQLIVSSTSAIVFSNIAVTFDYDGVSYQNGLFTGSFTLSTVFVFNIQKQMPDIKILEFLTGLFKTFNLTAFVVNGVIQVKPLDDFYTGTNTYDITEFVDVNTSKVDVALPYKEVVFKFKDTKSFLANKFSELQNRSWGETNYNDTSDDLSGQLYKIEVPFGHLLYERLTDASTAGSAEGQKDIQWGYSVDKSQNAYLGSPLLFYPVRETATPISFVDTLDADGVASNHVQITTFNRPFNSVSDNPSTNDFQLHFSTDASEYTGATDFTKNLFNEFYQNYIVSVFNTKQRLTKLKAYLPMRILLNYSLGDRFVLAGSTYKINSISTNLLTGESNIELINDL
jgi:hypothetical protein